MNRGFTRNGLFVYIDRGGDFVNIASNILILDELTQS